MAISDAEFHYIKDFIYQQAAIDLEPGKAYLVESRLQPIARREGFASLSDMIAKLRAQPANGLNWLVVEAMTTNETYFFRDVHPFELLKTKVLPELIKRRAAQRQINIWCAAASSGQEPYSIMMLLREHFPELSTWKINFTATDISNQMLNRCREGFYSQLEVNRGLPVTLLVKYFEKISTEWKIKDDLRRAIDFRQLNLAQPWPALATMEAKAAICSAPRMPGGSASSKSTKPAAIGTAFVTRVAMPAAVSALPCWNAAWSTPVPAA